jgi:hypothetical protein
LAYNKVAVQAALWATGSLFCKQVFECHVAQNEIGHHSFELGIFLLEPIQLLGIADWQASIFGFPLVENRLAPAVLSAEIGGLRSGFPLWEDTDNLLLGKSV